MSRTAPLLALALASLVATAGCEKAGPPPVEPSPEPPDALLAVVELPSATDMSALGDALSGLSPEAASGVTVALPMQIAGLLGSHVTSTDGLDLEASVRLLVVDPKSHPSPLVLIARRSGEVEAQKGSTLASLPDGFVAVGAPAAVDAVDAYAAHLATQPVAAPRAVGFPGNLLAVYRSDLEALPETMAELTPPDAGMNVAAVFEIYVHILTALGEQSDRAELTLSSDDAGTHVRFDLGAREGTSFADFIAAQEPSSFRYHERLPAAASSAVFMEASLVAGPLRAPMIELATTLFDSVGAQAPAEDMAAILARYADLLTGDSAMAMRFHAPADLGGQPDVEGIGVYGVTGGAEARAATDALFAQWTGTRTMLGMEHELRYEPAAFEHAGIAVGRTTTTMQVEGAEPLTQSGHFAAVGDALVYGMGTASETLTRAAIDELATPTGGLAPGPALERVLARARAEKASAVMFMDLAALMQSMGVPEAEMAMAMPSIAMTAGFDARTMRWTTTILPR